jgi:TPR repeat protein
MSDLEELAEGLRKSDIHYLRLVELGVAQDDHERSAVFFLVALERQPGHADAVTNLDYVAEQGVDVLRLKAELGFEAVAYPPVVLPPPPSAMDRPELSAEDAAEAEHWYQKAFDAIYSGWDVERACYLKALEHDPNMRKAWHELRNAAKQAGRFDLAERCDEAERILDQGGFIKDIRELVAGEV